MAYNPPPSEPSSSSDREVFEELEDVRPFDLWDSFDSLKFGTCGRRRVAGGALPDRSGSERKAYCPPARAPGSSSDRRVLEELEDVRPFDLWDSFDSLKFGTCGRRRVAGGALPDRSGSERKAYCPPARDPGSSSDRRVLEELQPRPFNLLDSFDSLRFGACGRRYPPVEASLPDRSVSERDAYRAPVPPHPGSSPDKVRSVLDPLGLEREKIGAGGCFRRGRAESALPECDIKRLPGILEVGKHLGSGTFGSVWECVVAGCVGRVAVKIPKHWPSKLEDREYQLLTALQHPNLVKLLLRIDGPPCAMVFELCPGGTLAQLVHDPAHHEAFSELTIRARIHAVLDVATCLEYLHANSVLHRDVKSSNCLLSSRHERRMDRIPPVKLADLGLARYEAEKMSGCVGTLAYMAPELIEGEHYGPAVDVYSCGMLLYELAAGKRPFSTSDQRLQNDVACVLAVSMGERPSLDDVPQGDDAGAGELRDILRSCWEQEPERRPTAAVLAGRLRVVWAAP